MLRRGYQWPCVPILEDDHVRFGWTGMRDVPIDLESLTKGSRSQPESSGEWSDLAHAKLFRSGLGEVVMHPVDTARRAFIAGLARVLSARATKVDRDSNAQRLAQYAPPIHKVTIHTNHDHQTLLFTKGHFISTQTIFGISTPAQRGLPAGFYKFGSEIDGEPRYQRSLWDVNQDLEFHLEVA
jgi:hypothetical protein